MEIAAEQQSSLLGEQASSLRSLLLVCVAGAWAVEHNVELDLPQHAWRALSLLHEAVNISGSLL